MDLRKDFQLQVRRGIFWLACASYVLLVLAPLFLWIFFGDKISTLNQYIDILPNVMAIVSLILGAFSIYQAYGSSKATDNTLQALRRLVSIAEDTNKVVNATQKRANNSTSPQASAGLSFSEADTITE